MKILLVDDDPHILRSIPRLLDCERDGWSCATAGSTAEALAVLEHQATDVIISDVILGGADGISLLQQVGTRFPRVSRIILTGQPNAESVMRSIGTMHQYLSKPCEPARLLEALDRVEIVLDSVRSPEILNLIGALDRLPSMPAIAAEISEAIASDLSTSNSIAQILARDPNLVAKSLQLANSPIFGLRHSVSSVDQAVTVIGSKMVQSLALLQVYADPSSPPAAQRLAGDLFHHCFEVALLARQICKIDRGDPEPETSFTAGLLHDLGKLVLVRSYPDVYPQLLRQAAAADRDLCELEDQQFGATHAAIGAHLLNLWGLPRSVVEAVAWHHDPAKCEARNHASATYVFAANHLVRGRPLPAPRGEAAPAPPHVFRKLAAWAPLAAAGDEEVDP